MQKTTAILLFLFFSSFTFGQTLFWSDTFEDAGAPSSGVRTPSINTSLGGPPATRYFWRCGTADISTSNVYTGFEGSKFWAGEDHRLVGTNVPEQRITWNNINISGKTNLQCRALFAVGNTGSVWDIIPTSPLNDFLGLEYRIDGGAWRNGICFMSFNPTISTPLSINANAGTGAGQDSIGDGTVLLNSAAFTEFFFDISGTGTTLELRLRAHSNALTEEWAVDNIRLYDGLSSLPVKLSGFEGYPAFSGNNLLWSTEQETDNAGFEIERSADGIHFTKTGFVSSKGNGSSRQEYRYTDELNVPVTAYYRLKQVDINGNHTYSDIITIRRTEKMSLQAYPNPFSNRLYVTMKGINNNMQNLQLMDVAGRLYPVNAAYVVNGFVLSTEKLPAGVYFLQCNNEGALLRTMIIKR